MGKRIYWLDVLRGLGIILIIIIHSTGDKNLISYLGSFAVPLFFFVSGFTLNRDRYARWSQFFFNRLKTRIVPYTIWFFVFYLFVMVKNSHSKEESISYLVNLTRFDVLAGFTMGDFYWLRDTIGNGPLWFLPCLFLIENTFYFVSNLSSTILIGVILIAFSCSAQFLLLSSAWTIPYILNMATAQIFFYGSGFIVKKLYVGNKFNAGLEKRNHIVLLWVLLSALSIWGGISLEVSPNTKFSLEHFLCRCIVALSGIVSFSILANYIEDWSWLRYLGKNTLIILLLYEPLRQASLGLFFLISFVFFDNIFNSYREIFTFLQVITVLILSVPCIFIINNYLPFLIARQYKTSGTETVSLGT